jgi:mannose-6-phosphate isomerase
MIPDDEASLVACFVPNLAQEITAPLRAAGYDDAAIRTLGKVGL